MMDLRMMPADIREGIRASVSRAFPGIKDPEPG